MLIPATVRSISIFHARLLCGLQRGVSPLMIASINNYVEIARLLIDTKADPNLQEKVRHFAECDLHCTVWS
jgi:hypothetical protein